MCMKIKLVYENKPHASVEQRLLGYTGCMAKWEMTSQLSLTRSGTTAEPSVPRYSDAWTVLPCYRTVRWFVFQAHRRLYHRAPPSGKG